MSRFLTATSLFLILSISLFAQWKADPNIEFVDYPGNPIKSAYGNPGSWNDAIRYGVQILSYGNVFEEGRRVYMTGFDGANMSIGFFETGVYTDSFIEFESNPVFTHDVPGKWDDRHVSNPMVLPDGDGYKMYYVGSKSDEKLQIGLATSNDGVSWTRHSGNPVLTKGASESWEDDRVFMPYVIKHDTTYMMYYSGDKGNNTGGSIGLATSENGIDWNRYEGNPVLAPGIAWENFSTIQPLVIELEDHLGIYRFLMAYSGFNNSHFNIGLARSEDGYSWEKYEGNPVIQCVYSLAWKKKYLLPIDMFLTASGDSIAIAYAAEGDDGFRNVAIAYAAIDPLKIWVDINDEDNRPGSFSLKQNYPNPFNPSTVISYQLPAASQVSVNIYNSLGQKVKTLYNGQQQMGFHELTWDGRNDFGHFVSAGIYFYCLKTKNSSETKKMILLK